MKTKMIISLLTALILALCMFPSVSLAEDISLADGQTFDISELSSGGTAAVAAGTSVTITGSNSESGHDVQISCGEGAAVTLDDVIINNSSESPVKFTGSGTLILNDGTVNKLKTAAEPGVWVSGGGAVTIEGTGSLEASGANAGIGIGSGSDATITISGGTVFAAHGAGGTKDIDAGTTGTLNISGSAAVFLQHDSCTAPTTATHDDYDYSAGTAAVYGVSIPSDWTDAFGAYLRVCTLTYNANGGEGAPSEITQLYGTTVSAADGAGMSNGGLNFNGWNTEADGSGTSYASGDTYTFNENDVLYAQWDGTDVTVKSENDYGTVSGGGEYEPGTLVTVTATANPGYYFAGWYKGGKLVSVKEEYEFTAGDDVTLTADFDTIGVIGNLWCQCYTYCRIGMGWWSAPGATHYEIWRSTSENGTYKLVYTKKGTDYGWEDSSLKVATTYYYKLRPFRMSGTTKIKGNYSLIMSETTYLDKVSLVYAPVVTATTVKLSWHGIQGETKYEIWRTDIKDAAAGDYTLAGSTRSKVFTDTGLTTDHTYYYVVVPYRSENGTRIYAEFSSVEEVTPVVGQVTGVKASRSSSSKVKVYWSGVSGAAKYEVWVSNAADGTYTLLGTTSSKYYYDKAAVKGTARYYKIRAYNTIIVTKHYGDYSAPKMMP